MTFKNSKTKKSTAKKFRCVVKPAEEKPPVVDEAAKITAIKQEQASSLAATFSADVTGITYGAIKVVRDETNAIVTVKSITVDANDKTKAVIEVYESLTDGKAYTVTYTATDGTESSAAFTATSGTVADIALNTYSIPANTPTEIKYQTLDANGVIIAEAGIGSSAANYMEISVENANGYQKDDDLLLYKTGDTATVKVIYHTFKYNNTNGTEEGKVEKTFTITAVDQSTVIKTFDYTVANQGTAVDFKHDKLISQVAIEDDNNGSPYAYFSFRTAADKDITPSLDYTVSSGNENVLLASGTVAGGAQLTPVGVGATYLVIKNAEGTVITTLPITVVAKRSLSTMTVDKSNVTISASAGTIGNQKITVAVMDQYSDPYTSYSIEQPELKSNNDDGNLSVTAAKSATNKTVITVDSSAGAPVGTYVYTMKLIDSENANNEKLVSFTVIVSARLNNNETYALVMMDGADSVSKIDTTVTTDDFHAVVLKPTVVVKNNGSITGEADVVSIGALKVTKNGASVDNTNKQIYDNDAALVSDAAINVTTGDGVLTPITKWLEPGTYTVSFVAKINMGSRGINNQNMSTSFVVEDSQKAFEASVKKEAVEAGIHNLDGVFTNKNYVTFTYAGHELESGYTYDSAKYTKVNNGNALRVSKVTMTVSLPGTGTTSKIVKMTANVNRTFTFSGGVVTEEMLAAQAKANEYASAATSQAIDALEAATGAAVGVNANFADLSSIASGASITISNVKLFGDPSEDSTGTSCAAISSAGIVSGDALTVNGAGNATIDKSHPTVSITLPQPVTDALAANDTLVIDFTLTVNCTVDGQPATPITLACQATYTWQSAGHWGSGSISVTP